MLAGFLYRAEASCARAAEPAPARPLLSSMNNPPASQNPVKDRITKPVANATVHTRGLASARVLIGRALNSRSFRSLGSTYPYDDVFPPPGPKVTP